MRRVGDEVDHIAARRPLVAFEQAPELPLQAAYIERAARPPQALPEPRQPVLDSTRKPLVHGALFLATLDGADEHEGLEPVRADTRLRFDPVSVNLLGRGAPGEVSLGPVAAATCRASAAPAGTAPEVPLPLLVARPHAFFIPVANADARLPLGHGGHSDRPGHQGLNICPLLPGSAWFTAGRVAGLAPGWRPPARLAGRAADRACQAGQQREERWAARAVAPGSG